MKILPALFLIFAATFTAFSQTTPDSACFSISNSGKPPRTGEIYKFTLAGPPDFDWTSVKLKWTINPPLELAGASTREVSVKWDRSDKHGTITASVEIDGTPGNCAKLLTETMSWDGPADPVKVGIWKVKQDESPFKQFAADMVIHPDNQGLVYIIRGPDSTEVTLNELRTATRRYADQNPTRLTLIETEGSEELAEIWRVPPGAENPKCESCGTAECPTVTVSGPAGVWLPGEQITFSASMSSIQYKSLSYRWTIEGGTIADGQGTTEVKVITPKGDHAQITATLKIDGLPSACPVTFAETAGVAVHYTARLLDEFQYLYDR